MNRGTWRELKRRGTGLKGWATNLLRLYDLDLIRPKKTIEEFYSSLIRFRFLGYFWGDMSKLSYDLFTVSYKFIWLAHARFLITIGYWWHPNCKCCKRQTKYFTSLWKTKNDASKIFLKRRKEKTSKVFKSFFLRGPLHKTSLPVLLLCQSCQCQVSVNDSCN